TLRLIKAEGTVDTATNHQPWLTAFTRNGIQGLLTLAASSEVNLLAVLAPQQRCHSRRAGNIPQSHAGKVQVMLRGQVTGLAPPGRNHIQTTILPKETCELPAEVSNPLPIRRDRRHELLELVIRLDFAQLAAIGRDHVQVR